MREFTRAPIHAAFLCLAVTLASPAAQTPPGDVSRPCRDHPQLVDTCFTIRGRMSYYNGTPSVRIWRVGTTRLLGVSEGRFKRPDVVNLPPEIQAKLSWETDLFADFAVCPFTRDEPGVMRLVCVDSAKNMTVRPRAHGVE